MSRRKSNGRGSRKPQSIPDEQRQPSSEIAVAGGGRTTDPEPGMAPAGSWLPTWLGGVLNIIFWLISAVGLSIIINILTGKTPLPTPLPIVAEHPWHFLSGALILLGIIRGVETLIDKQRANSHQLETQRGRRRVIMPTRAALLAKSYNLLAINQTDFDHVVNVELDIQQAPQLVNARHSKHGSRRNVKASQPLMESPFDFLRRIERLLLVGRPGAGKTQMLRRLCGSLLERAEIESDIPIPFILNLSTFSRYPGTLYKWLAEALLENAAIPLEIGQALLAEGRLFLLLDGLDEMPADRRLVALRELNVLLRNANPALGRCIIASRTQEYVSSAVPLLLPAALEIQEVSPTRLHEAIARVAPSAAALAAALERDPLLVTILRTPLLLTIGVRVFTGTPNLVLPGKDPEALRQQLFDAYVVELIRHRASQSPSPLGKTLCWLRWLALYLKNNQTNLFSIERLQLGASNSEQYFSLVFAIICGIAFGCFFAASGWLINWAGLFSRMMFGLGFGVLFGQLLTLAKKEITPVELLHWSWLQALSWWRIDLRNSVFLGAIAVLLISPLIGVLTALCVYLGGFIAGGWVRELDEQAARPNQGILSSIYNGLRESLVSVLVAGILGALVSWTGGKVGGEIIEVKQIFKGGIFTGLFVGLIIALLVGLGESLRHYLLRIFLYYEDKIPLRLVPWLESCRNHLLLRRQNGSYVFWHETLQEYFARLSDKSIAVLLQRIEGQDEHKMDY